MASMSFKIYYGEDIRRITLDMSSNPEADWKLLQARIISSFNFHSPQDFVLRVKDEDGDLCTVQNAEEFDEAIQTTNGDVLRIWVTPFRKQNEVQSEKSETSTRCPFSFPLFFPFIILAGGIKLIFCLLPVFLVCATIKRLSCCTKSMRHNRVFDGCLPCPLLMLAGFIMISLCFKCPLCYVFSSLFIFFGSNFLCREGSCNTHASSKKRVYFHCGGPCVQTRKSNVTRWTPISDFVSASSDEAFKNSDTIDQTTKEADFTSTIVSDDFVDLRAEDDILTLKVADICKVDLSDAEDFLENTDKGLVRAMIENSLLRELRNAVALHLTKDATMPFPSTQNEGSKPSVTEAEENNGTDEDGLTDSEVMALKCLASMGFQGHHVVQELKKNQGHVERTVKALVKRGGQLVRQ